MKFLYKLLNTLTPNEVNRLVLRNSELNAENQTCANYLSQFQIDNSKLTKELNELLATKTRLTAEVLKLREQLEEATKKIEVLEQLNEDFVSTNTNLLEIQNKLISEVEFLCNRVLELKITND